jgi:hypothetical protein
MTIFNPTSLRIAYQTGGTVNFRWQPVLGVFTEQEAAEKSRLIERMGYPTVTLQPGDELPNTFKPA